MRYLALTILMFLDPTASASMEYWPVQPDGVTYHYQNQAGEFRDIVYSENEVAQVLTYESDTPACDGGEAYSITPDSVGLWEYRINCEGAIASEYAQYDPPITIVTANMGAGDGWLYSGSDSFDGLSVVVVVETETIVVPFGEFEVLNVTLNRIYGPAPLPYWQVSLHAEYGPVRVQSSTGTWDLVGISGIVASEAESWCGVKAMYR